MNAVEAKAAAAKAFKKGFGGVIRIAPLDGASFDIDGRGETCVISDALADRDAECTWRASVETLIRVFEGGRALEGSYLSGRLSIAGDMSVMARLVLESPR